MLEANTPLLSCGGTRNYLVNHIGNNRTLIDFLNTLKLHDVFYVTPPHNGRNKNDKVVKYGQKMEGKINKCFDFIKKTILSFPFCCCKSTCGHQITTALHVNHNKNKY